MRSGCGWVGVRAMVMAMVLDGWVATGIEAGAIKVGPSYSTSGLIDPGGEGVPTSIEFRGVERDEIPPGPLTLGEFLVKDLPEGATVDYDRTPFFIDLMMDGADPISLSGELNGTVVGGGRVDVVVAFDPTPEVPTDTLLPAGYERWIVGIDGVTGILSLPAGDIALEAGSGDGTVVRAQIRSFEPVPIPEPASAAALLAGLAGMAWRRHRDRLSR